MHKRWKLSQLAAFSHAQDHLKVQTVGGGIGECTCGCGSAHRMQGLLSIWLCSHRRRDACMIVAADRLPPEPPLPPTPSTAHPASLLARSFFLCPPAQSRS